MKVKYDKWQHVLLFYGSYVTAHPCYLVAELYPIIHASSYYMCLTCANTVTHTVKYKLRLTLHNHKLRLLIIILFC